MWSHSATAGSGRAVAQHSDGVMDATQRVVAAVRVDLAALRACNRVVVYYPPENEGEPGSNLNLETDDESGNAGHGTPDELHILGQTDDDPLNSSETAVLTGTRPSWCG